mgnify:CR=1 FL=1
MLELHLPYPPTVNSLWQKRGKRFFLSKRGQAFRAAVFAVTGGMMYQTMMGRVRVEIEVYPPDRLKRDIDNVIKIILDSLQSAKVYADDAQVWELSVKRMSQVAGGLAVVRVWELKP